MVKINYKYLLLSILLPVFLGSFIGFLTAPFNDYYEIILPSFAPSGILFPIVWTILYILMGISSYIVVTSNSSNKYDALFIYGIQLVINLFWSVWILLLIAFVVIMIKKFYEISKLSAYLQIPYLLWLVFAGILNISIYLLNL